MAAMKLWHGTLLGIPYALRTSGVAFPFVLERLSNTAARPRSAVESVSGEDPGPPGSRTDEVLRVGRRTAHALDNSGKGHACERSKVCVMQCACTEYAVSCMLLYSLEARA